MNYSGANIESTVKLTTLTNPITAKQTKSFKVWIHDKDQYGVAAVTAGVYYKPNPGAITSVKLRSLGGNQI